MVIRKKENLRNKETGKLYTVKRLERNMVLLESKDGQEELLVTRTDIKTMYSKTLATKLYNFSRNLILVISIISGLLGFFFVYLAFKARGDIFEAHGFMALMFFIIAIYLTLQFYGAVWMYRLLATKLYNFSRTLILSISIIFWLLEFFFVYLAFTSRSGIFEDILVALIIQIYLLLPFCGGVWIYRLIVWIFKKF